MRAAPWAAAIGACLLASWGSAGAQEIRITGPLAGAPAGPRVRFGRHDASFWLGLGGSPAPEELAGPWTGLGAQVTFGALRVGRGSELRWGPWGQMWMDGVGGRAEGGLLAQLFRRWEDEQRYGVLDLRLGGGGGKSAAGDAPHLSVTIAGGPRYFEGPSARDEDAPSLVVGWRLFLSGRRTIEQDARTWVSGGLELELGFADD